MVSEYWAEEKSQGCLGVPPKVDRQRMLLYPPAKMDRRTAIIVLALLALVLIPVFCLGGVLDHPCGCTAAICGHEVGCGADPCSIVRASEVESGSQSPELELSAAPVVLSIDLALLATGGCEIVKPPPLPRGFPYHASDVPLRI